MSRAVTAVEVDVFEVEGVDVAWNVPKEGEADVDKQIDATSSDHEDTDWRKQDCDQDDQKGGGGVGHFDCVSVLRDCFV